MTYHLTSLGDAQQDALVKAGESCVALQSTKLKTAAQREQAFKDSAKCAAEAACTIYSKGAIPPGTCSTIMGPIANQAVKVWNSVYDFFSPDDQHEREVLAAQVVVPVAYSQLRKVEDLFYTHYLNVAAGLIDLNDSLLPAQKGKLGGGQSKTVTVVGGSKYLAPWSFPYKFYPDNRAVMERLAAKGAPPPVCASTSIWCSPPKVTSLWSAWAQTHGTAGSIEQLKKIQELSATASQWMNALNVAAVRVQNDIAAAAAREKVLISTAATMQLVIVKPPTGRAGRIVAAVAVVGLGAGGWWWWKRRR